jgi:hypothetical protein
MKWLTQQ